MNRADDSIGRDTGRGDGAASVSVHILGLPLHVWAQAEEHVDGLLREFRLIAASDARGGEAHVPRQLLELVDELDRDYAAMTTEQQSQLVDAADRGLAAVDLVYRVTPDVADACVRLDEAMDVADQYCRDGRYLLSLATPPEALDFRKWYLGEFVRQIAGQPPEPWEQWVASHGRASRGTSGR